VSHDAPGLCGRPFADLLLRFPPHVAHGIQASDDGLEFLLVFSCGNFDSTGMTFMLSDWLVHTPLEIVAQNLGLSVHDLQNIPQRDPVFKSSVPPPQEGYADEQAKASPDGELQNPYVFSLSEQPKEVSPGGWVKIQDSTRDFKESWAASAYVYVEPNGLRELHWHPDEGASNFISRRVLVAHSFYSRVALRHFRERKSHSVHWWSLFEDLQTSSR
jgi:oxalate decarboxylase/phosphoglucose isomerase-like protein (cupin superfamily)